MTAIASTAAEAAVVGFVSPQLYIDGEWRDASGERTLPVEDPSTGETLSEVADGTPEDAVAALDAAASAQAAWAASSPNERGEILRRAFDAIVERSEQFSLLMTLEMGKPLAESRAEVAYAAEFFRWFSGEALRLEGGYKVSGDGKSRVLVMRQPVGPSLLITPWNFPLAMGTRKIGPAIAAGCTMIAKPAKQTPLTMLLLAQVLEDCGLPPGVLNLITTSSSARTMAPVLSDRRLRKLSFTGSTEVGRTVIEQSAQGVVNVSMELGGNAPFLIFDDADLDAVVDAAMIAKMRNIGEACTAANRFYAAPGIAEEFAERLAARMGSMTVGRGTDRGIEVGPLIDEDQRSKVAELVDDAAARGGHVLVGGSRIAGLGYFFEPTVIGGVAPESRLLHEEIFGPVAPVVEVGSEEGAVAAANDTEYGLVAYVFTRDMRRAMRVCEQLQTGMVGLNQGLVSNAGAPFGGVKQSGIGREGGNEGILEFLETKYVAFPSPLG